MLDRIEEEIIIAGFGGQGIMFIGQILAYAGMLEGRNVSWMPSYGPEMRGGTANCGVIISSEEIASPVVAEPTSLIIMNQPSLAKFEPSLVTGGLLVYNSSLIEVVPQRNDVICLPVPANTIAESLGDARISNMVALGAYLARKPVVEPASIIESLKKVLPPERHTLILRNIEALNKGLENVPA